jgi:hypothetical protein
VSWRLTGVYGPQGDLEKKMILRELKRIKPVPQDRWLIIGDFNMVYQTQDKNNGRLNRSLKSRFRRTLNYLEVKEIELVGRRFTWSNNQVSPTLTRIDHAFCSSTWEEVYANPILNPVSSSTSDHCPLILMPLFVPSSKPKFKFESFWPQMPGSWIMFKVLGVNLCPLTRILLESSTSSLAEWKMHLRSAPRH